MPKMLQAAEYLVGVDAIDLARIAGLQLHRGATRPGDTPDTHWSVADSLIAGGASPDEFFIDVTRLSGEDSANAILSLIGLIRRILPC